MADWPVDAPRVEDTFYQRVCEFYYDEADLLAERRYARWFALLAPEIEYRVNFPEFYEHGTQRKVGIGVGTPYFEDNHKSLKVRTELLGNPVTTTAENPPSMFNYFVTNIRVRRAADAPGVVDVDSRLLITRVRASEPTPYLLGARRRDRLRVQGEGFLIARRVALMDQAVIQSPNMSWLF